MKDTSPTSQSLVDTLLGEESKRHLTLPPRKVAGPRYVAPKKEDKDEDKKDEPKLESGSPELDLITNLLGEDGNLWEAPRNGNLNFGVPEEFSNSAIKAFAEAGITDYGDGGTEDGYSYFTFGDDETIDKAAEVIASTFAEQIATDLAWSDWKS